MIAFLSFTFLYPLIHLFYSVLYAKEAKEAKEAPPCMLTNLIDRQSLLHAPLKPLTLLIHWINHFVFSSTTEDTVNNLKEVTFLISLCPA